MNIKNNIPQIIHVALAFDHNYLVPLHALLASVFDNNKKNYFHFHFIAPDILIGEKLLLKKYIIENENVVSFYEIDKALTSGFVLTNNWTKSVYYRIFFPLLLPDNIERLLYIDTDTIVIGDLTDIYDANIGNYPLGAVYDNYVKHQPNIGVNEEGQYFNSGMLLINIKLWNKQKISENAIEFIQQSPEKIIYVDQDALNAVLKGNWFNMDARFNLLYSYIPDDLSKYNFKEYLKDKVIIHFTLHRPWSFLCKNRFRYLYKYYLKVSIKREEKVITDFRLSKIISFIKLRFSEYYKDNPLIQKSWRKINAK